MANLSPTMAYCLYCDQEVTASSMTDEHIWPDALGGDALPDFWRTEVCGRCNAISGIYVDGSFIKSWIGMAERVLATEQYLSPTEPDKAVVPFNYLGSLPDEAAEGETVDWWVGHCGSTVFHFRGENESDLFDRFAGGDPRKLSKKGQGGRAYLALTSPEPFWQKVAIHSFDRQFKRAQRFRVSDVDSSLTYVPPLLDANEAVQAADLPRLQKLSSARKIQIGFPIETAVGNRMLAKLGLAMGYKLFGSAFLTIPYAKTLRSAFREGDPDKNRISKVRGSSILSAGSLGGAEKDLQWPGGWLLWLKRNSGEVALTVLPPSGKPFAVVVCDDAKLSATLADSYDDGLVWLVIPAIEEAAGPIEMPDYIAHQLACDILPELQALANRRTNRSDLPDCGLPEKASF